MKNFEEMSILVYNNLSLFGIDVEYLNEKVVRLKMKKKTYYTTNEDLTYLIDDLVTYLDTKLSNKIDKFGK